MIVPRSEAVERRVPSWFIDINDSGESCAEIMQTTSKESVLTKSTLPSADVLPESKS